jgi:hypothetical protein
VHEYTFAQLNVAFVRSPSVLLTSQCRRHVLSALRLSPFCLPTIMRCGLGPYIADYPEYALLACIVQGVLWDQCGIVRDVVIFSPFFFYSSFSWTSTIGVCGYGLIQMPIRCTMRGSSGHLGTNLANVGSTYWTISVA